MSIRDGLLAVLTLGPAYGLQLHSELTSRAPHRKPVNVGQIYSTLDRLVNQQLIKPAGLTADALPLYQLTTSGRKEAGLWMSTPSLTALPEWTEMLDQILVTSTVNPSVAKETAERYRHWWEANLAATRSAGIEDAVPTEAHLAVIAREAQSVAALAWLGTAIAALAYFDSYRPLSDVRPKRGRKPRPT